MKQTEFERLLVLDVQLLLAGMDLTPGGRWRWWRVKEQAIEDHHAGFLKRQAVRQERWRAQETLALAMMFQRGL